MLRRRICRRRSPRVCCGAGGCTAAQLGGRLTAWVHRFMDELVGRPSPELLQQLRRRAGQLHAHALDAVAQLRADSLHNGNGAVLVQVDLCVLAGWGGEEGRSRGEKVRPCRCSGMRATGGAPPRPPHGRWRSETRSSSGWLPAAGCPQARLPSSRGPSPDTPGTGSRTCGRRRRRRRRRRVPRARR